VSSPGFKASGFATLDFATMPSDKHSGKKFLLCKNRDNDLANVRADGKGFILFCNVQHQANADSVDLDMPASRVLIFGNPVAGTKLMQKDIAVSIELPLRIAIVDKDGETVIIQQTTADYCKYYRLENHRYCRRVNYYPQR
jgi:hypothetical protein